MNLKIPIKNKILILLIFSSCLFPYLFLNWNVSALETYGKFGVYWNDECTEKATSVEWGILNPGSEKSITLFIQNEGENTITLSLSTDNWNPLNASEYFTFGWNYNGELIKPEEKIQVRFTLTIPLKTYIGNFSYDILIIAEESILTLSYKDIIQWCWTNDTQINSIAVDDVDGDGDIEIITAGYFTDNKRISQLIVWNRETLSVERIQTWFWTNHTQINSIAVDDVDGDGDIEIITGGYFTDVCKVAQLIVWNGETLTVERMQNWFRISDTEITSLRIEDIDGDGSSEIITGGYYNDGVRDVAQLAVWNGGQLSLLKDTGWYWTDDTRIIDLQVNNLDDDITKEIVTAGYFTDVCKVAQLIVWNGETLTVEKLTSWFDTNDTVINSVSCEDLDSDMDVEIVSGGYFNDGNRDIAQLIIWNSQSMSVEQITGWYWINETRINSIIIRDVNGDNSAEIITSGYYNDLSRDITQLIIWDANTLNVDYFTSWFTTNDTHINALNIADIFGDFYPEIITGGYFYDNVRNYAQTTIWQIS